MGSTTYRQGNRNPFIDFPQFADTIFVTADQYSSRKGSSIISTSTLPIPLSRARTRMTMVTASNITATDLGSYEKLSCLTAMNPTLEKRRVRRVTYE